MVAATYFGNPALPALQGEGLIKSPPSWYCLRVGYMADSLYTQRYKDEFTIDGATNPSNSVQLATEAATITLDFKNCFDLTLLLGSAQIQIDQEVYAKRQFAWGVGSKWILYRTDSIYCSIDLKYFESEQKPLYFVSDGYAFDILSDFKMDYTEMQAAFGAAYQTGVLSPYLYLTYLYSKIEPRPDSLIVQIPYYDDSIITSSRSVLGARRWGMAVGATLIGGKMGSVTVESRFFNQNAINISGEIRF
jgi:hypothetical protein